MDRHRASKVACLRRAEDAFDSPSAGSTLEPAGDQNHVSVARHPEALELIDHRGDRLLARVARRTRQRQGAWLDDDRDVAASGDEIGEARSREGIAERFADRGGDIAQRVERWWRHEEEYVVLERDER